MMSQTHRNNSLRSLMMLLLVVLPGAQALAQDDGGGGGGEALSAAQIVERATEEYDGFGFEQGAAQITLVVEDKAGTKKSKKLDVKSKKIGGDARSRVTLLAPKEVKGQAFLFVEDRTGEDDVWMYLPAFSVTRRIAGAQKRGAFLGSHMTYRDLESRDLKDATQKRLADEKLGKNEVYVVESTPKGGAESDYQKVVAYIRKGDFVPLKIKYYGEKDELIKTLFVEKLDRDDKGRTLIKRMTLRPARGGYTTILVDALDTAVELPDSIFGKEQLGK